MCVHVEDGNIVPECTRKYKANDDESSSTESTDSSSSNNNSVGETIDIDTYFINLLVNETGSIKVIKLPSGYSTSDVVYSSNPSGILSVDQSGNIKAISPGQTEITVATKDGKHHIKCAIVVNEEKQFDYKPLPGITA